MLSVSLVEHMAHPQARNIGVTDCWGHTEKEVVDSQQGGVHHIRALAWE